MTTLGPPHIETVVGQPTTFTLTSDTPDATWTSYSDGLTVSGDQATWTPTTAGYQALVVQADFADGTSQVLEVGANAWLAIVGDLSLAVGVEMTPVSVPLPDGATWWEFYAQDRGYVVLEGVSWTDGAIRGTPVRLGTYWATLNARDAAGNYLGEARPFGFTVALPEPPSTTLAGPGIGADVAAQLPFLRGQAESLMVDACTIVGAPWAESTVDGVTTRTGTTKYAGKCVARPTTTQAAGGTAGGVDATVTRLVVKVPHTVTSVVRDDEVTITASDDPDLVGVTVRVESVQRGTFSVQRRLVCSDPQNTEG